MRVHEQTDQSLRPRPGVLQRRANSHGQGQAAHLGPERILALQRAAGNRAASDLLQGVVQRCGPVPCACPDQQGLQQADVVQRAVNLQPGVSPKTRDAILKLASEMGYVANRSAQKLSGGDCVLHF